VRLHDRPELAGALAQLTEQLAAAEHERWAHWQRYVHSKGLQQPDGSIVLPADLVSRWEQQIATQYAQLTEQEKESDRDQVRKYLPLILALFKKVAGADDDRSAGTHEPRT
jgi:hypothetical protein